MVSGTNAAFQTCLEIQHPWNPGTLKWCIMQSRNPDMLTTWIADTPPNLEKLTPRGADQFHFEICLMIYDIHNLKIDWKAQSCERQRIGVGQYSKYSDPTQIRSRKFLTHAPPNLWKLERPKQRHPQRMKFWITEIEPCWNLTLLKSHKYDFLNFSTPEILTYRNPGILNP